MTENLEKETREFVKYFEENKIFIDKNTDFNFKHFILDMFNDYKFMLYEDLSISEWPEEEIGNVLEIHSKKNTFHCILLSHIRYNEEVIYATDYDESSDNNLKLLLDTFSKMKLKNKLTEALEEKNIITRRVKI